MYQQVATGTEPTMERRTFADTDTEYALDLLLGHVTENAPNAVSLSRVEDAMDSALHRVWLDEATATVWHAMADMDDRDLWHLETETASEAIDWLDEIEDTLDDGTFDRYECAGGYGLAESDLAVLDEIDTVRLAGARAHAQAQIDTLGTEGAAGAAAAKGLRVGYMVDAFVLGRIELARRELGRLARLRAHHVRELVGDERGGQARAAKDLGITPVTVHNIVKADDERRDRVMAAARDAVARYRE